MIATAVPARQSARAGASLRSEPLKRATLGDSVHEGEQQR